MIEERNSVNSSELVGSSLVCSVYVESREILMKIEIFESFPVSIGVVKVIGVLENVI